MEQKANELAPIVAGKATEVYNGVILPSVTSAADSASKTVSSKLAPVGDNVNKALSEKLTADQRKQLDDAAAAAAKLAADGVTAATPVVQSGIEAASPVVQKAAADLFTKASTAGARFLRESTVDINDKIDSYIQSNDPTYTAPPVKAMSSVPARAPPPEMFLSEPDEPAVAPPALESIAPVEEAAPAPAPAPEPAVVAAPAPVPAPAPVVRAPEPEPFYAAAPAPAAAIQPTGAPGAAVDVPWAAFGVAFTVFPASVILLTEAMKSEGGASEGGEERSAQDIFMGGVANLKDEPSGWMFGEPSALYSNAEEAPPAAPEVTGVVEPTADAAAPVEEGEEAM